ERVLSWLTEELVRRGHDVTLFASGDSFTKAQLVATHSRGLRLADDPLDPVAAHVQHLAAVANRLHDFDVVHCHLDYLAFLLGEMSPTPFVHTLHGRLDV